MSDAPRMRHRPDWWLALFQAVYLLPIVRLRLALGGYQRTVRALTSRTDGQPEQASDAVPADVLAVASAVTLVARLVPARGLCLARSLTIWRLCRQRGYATDVVIGVAPPDGKRLEGHAWVEYRSVVLNDTSDVRTRYPVVYPADEFNRERSTEDC